MEWDEIPPRDVCKPDVQLQETSDLCDCQQEFCHQVQSHVLHYVHVMLCYVHASCSACFTLKCKYNLFYSVTTVLFQHRAMKERNTNQGFHNYSLTSSIISYLDGDEEG